MISSLLLVLDVADDVGDVLVALLLFFDEGRIVERLIDLDVLLFGTLDRFAVNRFLSRRLRIRLFELNELGLGGLRRHRLFAGGRRRRAGGGRIRTSTRWRERGDFKDGLALRANDRILAEVIEFRAAMATEALSAELGFRHVAGSLSGSGGGSLG